MQINLCNLHVDWSIWDMAHYPSEWKWLADFMSDAVRSENRWLMATRVTKGIVIHGNEFIISFLTCVHFLNTMEMKSEIARYASFTYTDLSYDSLRIAKFVKVHGFFTIWSLLRSL